MFLTRAGFGAPMESIMSQTGREATDWLREEFEKPATVYLPETLATYDPDTTSFQNHQMLFWNAALDGDDELRQRMVFALSQLFVVSNTGGTDQVLPLAYFMDVLSENAFGNYRDLMEEVTYSFSMARYLTYFRNRKGNPNTGRTPDENYARELLQLFTIGLVELNPDGTPRLDAGGNTIETYTNEDIVGLARVFTGFTLKGPSFWDGDPDGQYSRLVTYPEQHSTLEKSFLGLTIPENTGPEASVEMALDHIFNHPNLAPFISRQLIQRFTASSPSPAYVERVANAFETGAFAAANGEVFGSGQRGDLTATLAAILLDESLFDGSAIGSPMSGKVREPVLRFAHWARAFDLDNVIAQNERWFRNVAGNNNRLGQYPFNSPSVFNFYRPGYIAPGTQTGELGLTAPEFQIITQSSLIRTTNFLMRHVMDDTPRWDDAIVSFTPDYTDEIALAEDPAALAEHLSLLLTSGFMSDASKDRIVAVLNEIPIRTDNVEEDRLTRVHVAVLMALSTPAANIQY
ncbi:MAG: DUF1800 family protein [Pseudomonadota bacterium]